MYFPDFRPGPVFIIILPAFLLTLKEKQEEKKTAPQSAEGLALTRRAGL